MLIISKFFSKKRSPPSAKLLVEKTIVKITKIIFMYILLNLIISWTKKIFTYNNE